MRVTLLPIVACVVFCAASAPAWAHDARPLSVFIVEQQKNAYRVDVRMPPSIEAANEPEITFPEGCRVRSGAVRQSTDASVKTLLVTCSPPASGIEGQRIGVHYPLFNPSLSTLLRYSPADSGIRTAVLSPEQTEWVVPGASTWRVVAHDYLKLGIEHIWGGVDHLLFVTGLLLLAKTGRRIAVAVTGFTLAHSVTLSLSALGVVRLPLPPIEAGIALSILFLAREIARPDADSLARRYPLATSAFFGLFHGFGFAAALRGAGLPQNEIAPALLFFNAGVELGQLAFVAGMLGLVRVFGAGLKPATFSRIEALGAYALGIPAAFWFIQRLGL